MQFKIHVFVISMIIGSILSANSQDFNHPGAMHSKYDLDFVKNKIGANQNPWKNAYDKFLTTRAASYQGITPKPYASLEYQHHAYEVVRCGSFNNPNVGCNDMVYDGMAAYSLALRFYITEDNRYATKAMEIIDAWSTTYRANEESNSRLVVSWATPWYVNAAEILRYTDSSGWTTANTNRFNTLLNRFKNYIFWEVDGPVNNWMMSSVEARLAIAIFQNDQPAFDDAIDKWKFRITTYIYQTSDGVNPINPTGKTSDWTKRTWHDRNNRTSTIYVNGLCMETCRDISHTKLGFNSLMNGAEMAWNQDVDLFTLEKKRISDFLELHADWMMGGTVPDNICDGFLDIVSEDGFEIAYNHLNNRLEQPLPTTKIMLNRNRPQGASRWVKKWETMMYAERPFEDVCIEGAPNGFSDPVAEGNTVTVTGTVDIAYGACGNFIYLYDQNSNTPCSNAAFGGDPSPGVVKTCYTRTVTYPNIQSVTADQSPNFADNLIDNNTSDTQRWSANGFPQSVVIDYGSAQDFNTAELWTYEGRAYQYTIAVSNDPFTGFVDVVDRSANTSGALPLKNVFDPVLARYVRLTVTGASGYDGTWVSINELKMSSPNLSVDEFGNITAFKVYPNPSNSGLFTLSQETEWTVYDIRGIKIDQGEGTTVDISSFAKGLYVLKYPGNSEIIIFN